MNYRKVTRDAVRTALSAAVTGFNAQLAAIAAAYSIVPYTIDWAAESRQTFQGYISPEQIDVSQIVEYPAVVLYTSDAINENFEKGHRFGGQVQAHMDWYLRFKTGIEVDDVESILDATEDAALEAINDYSAWPANVIYNRQFQVSRDAISLLGEGWEQRIAVQMLFHVFC